MDETSGAFKHDFVRESAGGKGVPILNTGLLERAGFREMHVTGKVPREVDPKGSSAANVSHLAAEILKAMEPVEGVVA